MKDETLDRLFETVYASSAEAEAIWIAGLCIACVGLRRMDPFSHQRKLRNVERELREDLAGIAVVEAKIASHDDAKGHQ